MDSKIGIVQPQTTNLAGEELAAVEKRKDALLASVPHVLVSVSSGKPRPARMHWPW